MKPAGNQSMPGTLPPGQSPVTSLLPVARGAAPTQATPGGGMMDAVRGFFSQPMTPERQQMVMDLVQAGIASAGQGSPIAALLAPIAGSMIGRGVLTGRDRYAQEQGAASQQAMNALLGERGQDPRVQSAMQILNNPNAPAGSRAVAQAQVDRLIGEMFPAVARGGRGGASGGSTRLTGEINVGGYLYGRDNAGNMRPYLDQNGEMISVDPLDRSLTRFNVPADEPPEEAPRGGGWLGWLRGSRDADGPPDDPLGILDRPPA